MRDRLIRLIRQMSCIYADCEGFCNCTGCKKTEMFDDSIEALADHLLANGVIVPPCKVGDTVYYIHEGVDRVYEGEVTSFVYVSNTNSFGIHYDGGYGIFGRYVFLTREEAEQALKGGDGDG